MTFVYRIRSDALRSGDRPVTSHIADHLHGIMIDTGSTPLDTG